MKVKIRKGNNNLDCEYRIKEEEYKYEVKLCAKPSKQDKIIINNEIVTISEVFVGKDCVYISVLPYGRMRETWLEDIFNKQ